MAYPNSIVLPRGHERRIGEDTARYLVTPGVHFRRPYLRVPNGPIFRWPLGTEGFSYQSSAQLGIHRYIGKEDIEVNVIYRDEPHIQMTGLLPGKTGAGLMRELLQILEARTQGEGKILFLPYIFPRIQYVAAESWGFDHDGGDRTRDISYTISFLKVGLGRTISIDPPVPPGEPGQPHPPAVTRYFKVRDGYRTLRRISKKVYGSEAKWGKLYRLNKKALDKFFKNHHVPRHNFPTRTLNRGMKLKY